MQKDKLNDPHVLNIISWQFLKKPLCWNGLLFLIIFLCVLDAQRDPAFQISVRAYIGGIRFYQRISPHVFSGYVQCRYRPSCSNYSIQAVMKYGIGKGLTLSAKRIISCRPSVAMGTVSEVP